MLTLFLRAIIVYFSLLLATRLMGKKQLGELQPFELVITLVVADLACIPMQDSSIPLVYGIIPVFILLVLHIIITKLASVSITFRKILNGKPVVIITPSGIDCSKLKELDMNANDLIEAVRNAGYLSPNLIQYAIIETNGQLSVFPKTQYTDPDSTTQSIEDPDTIPYNLVVEGHYMNNNISLCPINITTATLKQVLTDLRLTVKDVFLLSVNSNRLMFIQPYNKNAITMELPCEN